MFHGLGKRADLADWEGCDHILGEDYSEPINYIVNGFATPHIACPGINYIVSQEARGAFEKLPGVIILPVEVKKVIYLPYSVGDFSYFDTKEFRTNPKKYGHDTIFPRLPDRKEFHKSVGQRFEIVSGSAHRLVPAYPEAKPVVLPDPTGDEAPLENPLSLRMLADHSMVKTLRGTAMTIEAFESIEPFLDLDYFAVADACLE